MSFTRGSIGLCALLAAAGACDAANPKEIEAAIQKGSGYLKQEYKGARIRQLVEQDQGVGVAALAGLALLETGTATDDPVVKAITAAIRDASFTQTQTYHIALCLLYLDRLDRLDESTDVPIIQMLAVRLLAGQNAHGGWTYSCIDAVPPADERYLRASLLVAELKAGANKSPPPMDVPGKKPAKGLVGGSLHADVEKYAGKLATSRRHHADDNSNTQFAILGIWAARKHGVPVEFALDLIEKRFLATQNPSGGWPYGSAGEGSPSMTCAGLIGLATAVGRREERRLKSDPIQKDDLFERLKPKVIPKPAEKSGDPFFNPPAASKSDDPFFNPMKSLGLPADKAGDQKKTAQKVPVDPCDAAVKRGLVALGAALGGNGQPGNRNRLKLIIGRESLGDRDLYFLWSLERVGVVFGLDTIAGIDWYDAGAAAVVPSQNADGSWGSAGRGSKVDTAFALLFLARSNLVRDLATKVQKDASNTELRAGAGPPSINPKNDSVPEPTVARPVPPATTIPIDPAPAPQRPGTKTDDSKLIARDLVEATDDEWLDTLARVRDAKGAANTNGLLLSIATLEGERKKAARQALAERLTRMTASTLREMVGDKNAELRRGAVLAMAMKDDKTHLPDLIAALLDDEDLVVRAARAGLKSTTGQDFGPEGGAGLTERTAAAKAWLEWLRKQR